jgi:hypothetical protein
VKRDPFTFPTPPHVYEVRSVCRWGHSPHRRHILREFHTDRVKAEDRALALKRAWEHCKTSLLVGKALAPVRKPRRTR